jgi:hypothetical protein
LISCAVSDDAALTAASQTFVRAGHSVADKQQRVARFWPFHAVFQQYHAVLYVCFFRNPDYDKLTHF